MRRLRNRLILLALAVAAVLALKLVPASSSVVTDFQPQCHFQTICSTPSDDRTFGTNGVGGGNYQP